MASWLRRLRHRSVGRRDLGAVVLAALVAGLVIAGPSPSIAQAREMTTDNVSTTSVPFADGSVDGLLVAEGQLVHHVADQPLVMAGTSFRGQLDHDDEEAEHPHDGDDEHSPFWIRWIDDGQWSPWSAVDPMEEAPDGVASTRVFSQPIWVDGAKEIQFVLPVRSEQAELHLVRETTTSISLSDATPRAEALRGGPDVNLRSEWGARVARVPARTARSGVQFGVVHHTGSTAHNSYGANDVPRLLRAIQAYHMDANGWNDIGYNFLVDRFGRIWEGRGGGIELPVIGAHAGGFNTGSVGVALLGHFDTIAPTSAAVAAIDQVIGWKLSFEGVDPTSRHTYTSGGSPTVPAGRQIVLGRVIGHRDVGATSCPGGSLYREIDGRTPSLVQLQANRPPAHPSVSVGYTNNEFAQLAWAAEYHDQTPEEFSHTAAFLLGYLSALEGPDEARELDDVPAVDGPYGLVTEFPGNTMGSVDVAARHFSVNRAEAVRTATYVLVYLSMLENG